MTKRSGSSSHLRIESPLSEELEQLVYKLIGAGMRVHSVLGPGLLERSYAEALSIELTKRGMAFRREVAVAVRYEGQDVLPGRVDFIVADQVVVEIKAVSQLHPVHSAQVIAYLRATGLPVAVILNFHARHLRDGIRRHVLSRKTTRGQRR